MSQDTGKPGCGSLRLTGLSFLAYGIARQRDCPTSLGITPRACTILKKSSSSSAPSSAAACRSCPSTPSPSPWTRSAGAEQGGGSGSRGGGGGGGGGGVYSDLYTRGARFLTRWDQHAVAQRRLQPVSRDKRMSRRIESRQVGDTCRVALTASADSP